MHENVLRMRKIWESRQKNNLGLPPSHWVYLSQVSSANLVVIIWVDAGKYIPWLETMFFGQCCGVRVTLKPQISKTMSALLRCVRIVFVLDHASLTLSSQQHHLRHPPLLHHRYHLPSLPLSFPTVFYTRELTWFGNNNGRRCGSGTAAIWLRAGQKWVRFFSCLKKLAINSRLLLGKSW